MVAILQLHIPDAVVGDVVDTFAAAHSWQASDGDKAAFCKRQLIAIIMEVLRAQHGGAAAESARQAAIAEVNALVTIT